MRTSLVVIFLVRIEQMAEMSLAEDNNMVKTLPSDRTDEPLRISVLPWRPWRDRSISYAVFCLKKKKQPQSRQACPASQRRTARSASAVARAEPCCRPDRLDST